MKIWLVILSTYVLTAKNASVSLTTNWNRLEGDHMHFIIFVYQESYKINDLLSRIGEEVERIL